MKKRTLIRTAWGFAALLLLLLLARTFVGSVFHVDSGSMEPTIHGRGGGEWVFVRYDQEPPRRNEIVVVLPASAGDPLVKRVAGLPFERVAVRSGDLWIDDHLQRRSKDDAVPRPFVTVFDERRAPLEQSFHMGSTQQNPWTRMGDAWRVDASTVPAGSDEGLMYFVPRLDDSYFGPNGELVHGDTSVNDAAIECEVFGEAARGRIRLQLTEQGDTFELALAPTPGGGALAVLTRRNQGDRLERLESHHLPSFAIGRWHHLRFSNVDDELNLELDHQPTPLTHTYERNEKHPADLRDEGLSLGARVLLGAETGAFRFRAIRIHRDLYHTPLGTYGTKEPLELGPDHYFLLGDNSSHSSDSRTFGPIPTPRIIGRALAIIWPPSHWRLLTP